MTGPPGWYPDPAGTSNRFRYWDGTRWTNDTAGTPGAPPARRRAPLLMIISAVAAGLVLIIVAVVVISSGAGGALGTGGPEERPAGTPTAECPPADSAPPTAEPRVGADGRVRGGPLSYPALGRPWTGPTTENRVPFGRDLIGQWVTADRNTRNGHIWAAMVLVGELNSGDGFLGPERAATLMAECITGTLYGDDRIDSTIKISKPTKVDGHDGWLLEARLAYDIAGLKTKGETMIIVIVDAGTSTGLFYAGLPDSGPQYVAPARAALRELAVEA
ncbi:DUF2510 domain-containing protein [Microlunatus sp. GCM10028923]|uniref:DUF2510 domain-containing protein n=1 Tax=Microlunatus sp. GCM10028923 TaxID=3273400 RepID=UPI00361BCEFA